MKCILTFTSQISRLPLCSTTKLKITTANIFYKTLKSNKISSNGFITNKIYSNFQQTDIQLPLNSTMKLKPTTDNFYKTVKCDFFFSNDYETSKIYSNLYQTDIQVVIVFFKKIHNNNSNRCLLQNSKKGTKFFQTVLY